MYVCKILVNNALVPFPPREQKFSREEMGYFTETFPIICGVASIYVKFVGS